MAKKEEKKEITVEERLTTLESENVVLGEANAKLAEDNASLAKEVTSLKGVVSKPKPKEVKKPTVPTGTFKADGVEYKFNIAIFNLPGFGVISAKDALKNKEVQARLVELNATGIITKVK